MRLSNHPSGSALWQVTLDTPFDSPWAINHHDVMMGATCPERKSAMTTGAATPLDETPEPGCRNEISIHLGIDSLQLPNCQRPRS